MNKKILLSLAVIGVAAAIAVGGTIAYFSDTETSTGNTFTAGAIDLKIDNESYVTNENGELVSSPGTSWVLSDLTDQLFFDFSDLKPGDVGEDTISLHVDSNDAWACMNITLTGTPENGQTEPEAAEDGTDGTDEGELQDELYFAFWADDGDNVYEEGEVIFAEGLAKDLFDGGELALADSQTNVWRDNPGTPLAGETDYYIGKVWCYGDLTETFYPQDDINTSGPLDRGTGFACDGSSVTNVSQTDGIVADVEFYAEQSRNNDDFVCGQQCPEPGTTLDEINVGDDGSMTSHNAMGWFNFPGIGNYGGGDPTGTYVFAMIGGDDDDNDVCDTEESSATFVMDAGACTATELVVRHLDGSANDSFDVYVNGNLIDSYAGNQYTGEEWTETSFDLGIYSFSGTATIELDVTGNYPWGSCPTYGQGAVNWAKITN